MKFQKLNPFYVCLYIYFTIGSVFEKQNRSQRISSPERPFFWGTSIILNIKMHFTSLI